MRRAIQALTVSALLGFASTTIACAAASALSSQAAGTVNFVKHTSSLDTSYLNEATSQTKSWMNQHFWHTVVFTPYFDSKTSWYPHGWAYKDLYAIYAGSSFASEHPSWILHNAAGQPLYIPWGCSDGTCPQFAGDIADPEYRHAWIAEAKSALAGGYSGLWIDDVNLVFAVGNDRGEHEAPIDPRTGEQMTEQAWEQYVVTFVEEIRAALPGVEIVHNSVWYAGGPQRWENPLVKREIAAADYINLERGVNDPNMTGGSGEWSLQAFLSFIDSVHAAGRGVLLEGFDNSAQGREYNLAAYFLVSTGDDGVGNTEMTPEDWWSGYETNLGQAEGARSSWQGLMRRDFSGGIVLLNEPQARTRTVTLPQPMLTTSGALVSSVTLAASSGAILRYPEGSAEEAPFGGEPEQPEESHGWAPSTGGGEGASGANEHEGSSAAGAGEGNTAEEGSGASEGSGGAREGREDQAPGGDGEGELGQDGGQSADPSQEAPLTLKAHDLRRAITLLGRLQSRSERRAYAHAHVQITLQRLQGSLWQPAASLSVTLRSSGRYRATLRHLRAGRYRALAGLLMGASTASADSNAFVFSIA